MYGAKYKLMDPLQFSVVHECTVPVLPGKYWSNSEAIADLLVHHSF